MATHLLSSSLSIAWPRENLTQGNRRQLITLIFHCVRANVCVSVSVYEKFLILITKQRKRMIVFEQKSV